MKNLNKILFLLLSFVLSIFTLTAQNKTLNADGPYIQYISENSARVISVDKEGDINDIIGPAPKIGDIIHVTEHSGQWSFDVMLKESVRPDWKVPASDRIFVMSDPHGRMDCMIELLQRWNVIDHDLNWSFGNNQLIVIGDVSDRGEDATQIYWLLYKLETEAEAAGGRMTYRDLMGQNTELGKWLATRNTIHVIGDNLFVHAGISPQMLEWNLNVDNAANCDANRSRAVIIEGDDIIVVK